ncbi:hypothetical protein L1887_42365 [Cichorium endivia]|nr:hypothetical protein L1887_42365 [Cichorium endivia]
MSDANQQSYDQQLQTLAQADAEAEVQARALARARKLARARAQAEAQAKAEAQARVEAQAQAHLNGQQRVQQAQSHNVASPAPQQAAVHRQAVSPVKHGETTHVVGQPASRQIAPLPAGIPFRSKIVIRAEPVPAYVEPTLESRPQPAAIIREEPSESRRQPASPDKHAKTTHARQQPAAVIAETAEIAQSEPVPAAVEPAPEAVTSKESGTQRRSASPAVASETGSARADDGERDDASVAAEEAREDSPECNVVDGSDAADAHADYERLMRKDDEETTRVQGDADDHDDYDMATIEHTLIYPPDGKVSIPFPPSELTDPLVAGMVPGSRRWRFEALPTVADEGKLISKIINMLLEDKFDLQECSISLPPAPGRERYVQIHFNLLADYVQAATLELTWNGRPMELVSSAAPLRKRSTVLKIYNISGPTEETIDNISSAIGDFVSIDNIWRLDRVVYINKSQSTITVKGSTLLILATFREHPAVGWYGPQDLPGFVATRSSTHALHFIGRTNRCGCCLPERNTPLNYVGSTDHPGMQRKRTRDDAASTPQPVQKKHKKDDKGKKQVDQPEN